MTTKQPDPTTIRLTISNKGGESNVHITGKVYQNDKHLANLDKRIVLGKKSEIVVEIYHIVPLEKNSGEWIFELSVIAENERGIDKETARGFINVIGLPKIKAEISKLNDVYSIVKGKSETITPTVNVKNLGSSANFNVYIEVRKDGHKVHSTTESKLINKNGEIRINIYNFKLDAPANEGKWEFLISIEANNEAGKDSEKLSARTEFIGEPSIKAERSLSQDKMRRGEDLVVTVTLENTGFGDANNVAFDDLLPQDFSVVEGRKSFKGTIKKGEKKTLSYTVKPSKKGKYGFTTISVFYDGVILKNLASKSNSNQMQVFGIPELKITRTLSMNTLLEGERVTVIVDLKNIGDGTAKPIEFTDNLPQGIRVDGSSYWTGELTSTEIKSLSYSIQIDSYGSYNLGPGTTVHRDEVGDKKYQPSGETQRVNVYVKPKISWESLDLPNYIERNSDFQITIKLKNAGAHGAPSEWIASVNNIDAKLSLPSGFYGASSNSINSLSGGDTKSLTWTLSSSGWGQDFSIPLTVTSKNANSFTSQIELDVAPLLLEKIQGYDERYCAHCVSGTEFYYFEEGSIKSSSNYWKGDLKHTKSIHPSKNGPTAYPTYNSLDDVPVKEKYTFYLDSTQSWTNRPFFITSDYLIYQHWYGWNYDGLDKKPDWERVEMWVNADTGKVEYVQTDTHYCSYWWKPDYPSTDIYVEFAFSYHTPVIKKSVLYAGNKEISRDFWMSIINFDLTSAKYSYENCVTEGANGYPH